MTLQTLIYYYLVSASFHKFNRTRILDDKSIQLYGKVYEFIFLFITLTFLMTLIHFLPLLCVPRHFICRTLFTHTFTRPHLLKSVIVLVWKFNWCYEILPVQYISIGTFSRFSNMWTDSCEKKSLNSIFLFRNSCTLC